MVQQRLPIVNSDDGVWGDIIRQYLMKEHFNDDTDNPLNGGHQKVTIKAGTTSAAPLTFTASGAALLTTPQDGAAEYVSSTLYITTGSTRKTVAIYNDASGATGDIYYRDSSGNFFRLGIGSTGQTLKVASGLPAWGSTNSGFSINPQTTNYTVTSTDTVVLANATSGNVTITLPAASGLNGYRFYVKRTDGSANTCTVAASDNIDGAASQSLQLRYTSLTIVSDGSTWYII